VFTGLLRSNPRSHPQLFAIFVRAHRGKIDGLMIVGSTDASCG